MWWKRVRNAVLQHCSDAAVWARGYTGSRIASAYVAQYHVIEVIISWTFMDMLMLSIGACLKMYEEDHYLGPGKSLTRANKHQVWVGLMEPLAATPPKIAQ